MYSNYGAYLSNANGRQLGKQLELRIISRDAISCLCSVARTARRPDALRKFLEGSGTYAGFFVF